MAIGTLCNPDSLEQPADDLRNIFETLPVGVLVTHLDGRLAYCNPAAERILGAGACDASLADCPAPYGWYLPDQTTLLALDHVPLARAMRGQEVVDELIFVRSPHQHGGVWIRASARPLKNRHGDIGGAMVMFRDVTAKQRSLQMKALLSHVVEQIADGVVLTNKHGIIEYVNPAFEMTTGYCSQEVLNQTPRILKSGLHDADFYRQLWNQLLDGRRFQGTIINRKKTGELYWAEQTITPIHDETGNLTHFFSVMQDVTELRKQQEQDVQLRLARKVQQQFYRAAPAVAGFDLAAAAYPAQETGGDYFDFIAMPHGNLVIAVGDVEGHGFGSALVMAMTRAYLRSFAAMGLEIEQILTQVNRMLVNDLGNHSFVTLGLASLDVRNRTLTYASAGHVPGYVLSRSGTVDSTLESTGPPLGLFADSRFTRHPAISLQAGQIMMLLTDGITESTGSDGAEFGASRAIEYLAAHPQDSAHQLVDGLYHTARGFAANQHQHDDITSVVLKVSD